MEVLQLISFLLILFIAIICTIIFFTSPNVSKKFKKLSYRLFKSRQFASKELLSEFSEKVANTLVKLSSDYVGALITIENNDLLDEYVEIGHEIRSKFSPELIFSIFYNKKSPLHDGAIIIRDGWIISVSSYFPTSNKFLDIMFGARHRAALGISEITDSITFVVSETNGRISMARNGKLTLMPQNIDELIVAIKTQLMTNN